MTNIESNSLSGHLLAKTKEMPQGTKHGSVSFKMVKSAWQIKS